SYSSTPSAWAARTGASSARCSRPGSGSPRPACEAIEHRPQRPLDKALLRQLATGRWIAEHHNVVVTGPTGTGKTFVACALAHQACRTGSRVLYRRVPRLFEELTLAHADGSYTRLLAR